MRDTRAATHRPGSQLLTRHACYHLLLLVLIEDSEPLEDHIVERSYLVGEHLVGLLRHHHLVAFCLQRIA